MPKTFQNSLTPYYKCERVITKNKKVEYCNNRAFWQSGTGVFTDRKIKVCHVCKKDLENIYTTHNKHYKKVVIKKL